MKISVIPQRNIPGSSRSISVAINGDSIEINGVSYDFSPLPDGATLTDGATGCEFIIGPVERVEGRLMLTLLQPITEAASPAAHEISTIINPPDGPLELPQ